MVSSTTPTTTSVMTPIEDGCRWSWPGRRAGAGCAPSDGAGLGLRSAGWLPGRGRVGHRCGVGRCADRSGGGGDDDTGGGGGEGCGFGAGAVTDSQAVGDSNATDDSQAMGESEAVGNAVVMAGARVESGQTGSDGSTGSAANVAGSIGAAGVPVTADPSPDGVARASSMRKQ